MGFGLPAALGAKVARPDHLVIDIDGDGSFLMNIQELATAYTEKIPVKILLLNNQHLGMVVQWEDRFFSGNRAHTYLGAGDEHPPYPDFLTIAEGFGIPARTIHQKQDLDDALRELIESPGSFLLNILVPHQEHVLPMIPSGMTVRDIIKV
jgi:acetolactate synthase-1/2/3 large subunit